MRAFDIWHVGRSRNDNVSRIIALGLWPWTLTLFVFWCWLLILGIWIDRLNIMCRVPWTVVYDLELWPQGQIPVFFSLTNCCPSCNFIVFWCGLLIFEVWVDHLNYIHMYGLISIAGPTEMDSISMISSFLCVYIHIYIFVDIFSQVKH